MRRVRRHIGAAALWVACASVAYAQPVLPSLQQQAEAALVAGDPARAAVLSRDLLATRPDSFAGAFLLAVALNETGDYRDAAEAAAQAYDTAPTQSDKLRAAQLAGTAWFAAGAFTRSEFWLRRAANHIQTEEEALAVVLAFQRSQAANPLDFRLGASIAPSDNINNGAEDEVFRLEGVPIDFLLPPERLALSGIEYSAEAAVSYRLSQSERQRTFVGAYLFGRTFSLSEAAQDILPDAKGSDFALVTTDLSLVHERQLFESLGPSSIGANVGRVWYSGDPIWDYQALTLQQGVMLGDAATLTLGTSAIHQTPLFAGASDVHINSASASLNTTLRNNDALQVTYAQTYSDGGFENIYDEYRIATEYDIAQPLWNTSWSLSFSVGYRDYDTFLTTLDGRRDTFATAGVDVVFRDVSYWGFSPEISVSTNRTISSAEEFSSSGVQGRVGIQSNF